MRLFVLMRRAAWVVAVTTLSFATGCGDDGSGEDAGGGDAGDAGEPIEPTYANVEQVVQRSCALSASCHGGDGSGQAMLNFQIPIEEGRPITEVLVDVESCEYDAMPLVDPENPDNSWLWIKIAGDFDEESGRLTFTPEESWDHGLEGEPGNYPTSTCPLVEDGEISFGRNMPLSVAEPRPLPDNELEMFRKWIEMGAPGPQ